MFRVSFSLLNPLPSLQLIKLQGLSIPHSVQQFVRKVEAGCKVLVIVLRYRQR